MTKKKAAPSFGRGKKGAIDVGALLMRGASSVAGPSKKGNEIGETVVAGLAGLGAAALANMATNGKEMIPQQGAIAGAIGGGIPGAIAVFGATYLAAELQKQQAGKATTAGVSSASEVIGAGKLLC